MKNLSRSFLIALMLSTGCFLTSVSRGLGQEPPKLASTPSSLTGSVQLTGNASLLGNPLPSLGAKLNLSRADVLGGSVDGRVEYYVEGSYNADPPGLLLNNLNEYKFETQVMFNRRIYQGLGITAGLLHHENFTFPDHYFWLIGGLTCSILPVSDITVSGAVVAEQKWWTGRVFYDFSGTIEYRFIPKWNVQFNYHLYENFGQFDPEPTQKEELEAAVNWEFQECKRRSKSVTV